MKYFLSLGSNVGDRERNLRRAVNLLKRRAIKILDASSLYETEPVGDKDQPWFINQVVHIESILAPGDLLSLLQSIERYMGRTKSHPGGPRLIDLDILLAEDTVLGTRNLVIPHPRLQERKFVLVPLNEIEPDARHPVLEKPIQAVLASTVDRSTVRLFRKKAVRRSRRNAQHSQA